MCRLFLLILAASCICVKSDDTNAVAQAPLPPLITQWFCDATVGCMYCWGTTCPAGKQLYATREACRSSSECVNASKPKWYCAYCVPQAQMVCYVCAENGCPANMGTTYDTVNDCMESSQCKSSYYGNSVLQ